MCLPILQRFGGNGVKAPRQTKGSAHVVGGVMVAVVTDSEQLQTHPQQITPACGRIGPERFEISVGLGLQIQRVGIDQGMDQTRCRARPCSTFTAPTAPPWSCGLQKTPRVQVATMASRRSAASSTRRP